MFITAYFNHHRGRSGQRRFSFLRLSLILVSVASLLAYPGGPLTPIGASGVGRAGRARANSLNNAAVQPSALATPVAELTDAIFQARGLAGKCIAFGGSGTYRGDTTIENNDPVFLSDCNGTSNQQVRVVELRPGRYRGGSVKPREVQLRAGDKCIGAGGNFIVPNVPLLLQDCNGSRGQTFALDGDSIIFANERSFVVEVRNARSQNGTPLVVGERDLDDSEFWSFTAADGSDTKPTSGFVRVTNALELFLALQEAQWGTVIEVESGSSLNMQLTFSIPAGVTIRGSRRGLEQGAELWWPELMEGPMLSIEGDHTRLTGLRFRGPSRSTDGDLPRILGIRANDNFFSIIDHNELYDWPWAAIDVSGGSELITCSANNESPSSRQHRVRVARNFFHHNQRGGLGYGVGIGAGAYPLVDGNTFVSNRHAIAADGKARTAYRALFNLVLADAANYGNWLYSVYEHDFDMHGSDPGSHHTGGVAGNYVGIKWNTFLGTNRNNFDLRGVPCYLAEFHGNVSRRDRGGAIDLYIPPTHPIGSPISWVRVEGNKFESLNPTDRLGVGDFDGDGRKDTFLATGAAWYYAPGGLAEWRYLKNSGAELDELLLGDFDGDGRADVLTQSGRDWMVSWGGISRPEKINTQDGQISDYHIGDFNGDGRDDVFYANGYQWFLSRGAAGPLTPIAQASRRASDLRFGDFNGDGRTDIFVVQNGDWWVLYGGGFYWARLRSALTDKVKELAVADFDGDGRADVASSTSDGFYHDWRISSGGLGNWAPLRQNVTVALTAVPAIGQFDAGAGADVLFWPGRYVYEINRLVLREENYLDIASSGVGSARHSRQDMR